MLRAQTQFMVLGSQVLDQYKYKYILGEGGIANTQINIFGLTEKGKYFGDPQEEEVLVEEVEWEVLYGAMIGGGGRKAPV